MPSKEKTFEIITPDVGIKDTGNEKGRGVHTKRRFEAGEIVEVAPVVIMDDVPDSLQTYVFHWSCLAYGDENGNLSALTLGFGSMYNHNNPANMRYEADLENLAMRFIAVEIIEEGTELTINYNTMGGGATCDDDNWFGRHKIEPIK